VALTFEQHGFTEAHPLVGGYEAWKEAGLPVEPRREQQTRSGSANIKKEKAARH
jgi:3-mercaptopyruvate sulfurtransferase SseA